MTGAIRIAAMVAAWVGMLILSVLLLPVLAVLMLCVVAVDRLAGG